MGDTGLEPVTSACRGGTRWEWTGSYGHEKRINTGETGHSEFPRLSHHSPCFPSSCAPDVRQAPGVCPARALPVPVASSDDRGGCVLADAMRLVSVLSAISQRLGDPGIRRRSSRTTVG